VDSRQLRKVQKEMVVAYFKILFQRLSVRTDEN
jgi:hypothetical protein